MNTESMWDATGTDVLVVGGGPAGMMAAIRAAESGARVLLLERNEKTGKKLYITGKGRCNVTNTAEGEAFLREVPRNGKFLYAALRAFGRDDLLALLSEYGTETKVERGGRVFPVSDRASDVTRALLRAMDAAGVRVRLNARVRSVRAGEDGVSAVLESGERLSARALVVATGGVSYPATGSTGDGYRFARENGHATEPTRGSLVPLLSDAPWPRLLQGLSLRNVRLSAYLGKKQIYSALGEMLFAHFGFSGPLILEVSSHLPENPADARILLDLKPGMTEEEVDARLTREIAAAGRRRLSSVLQTMLPQRFAPVFAGLSGLDAETPAASVTREARRRMTERFKALPLPVSGYGPVEEAVVTRGGVSVREVDPKTMMSRLRPGLFFAGEVLDVDAHTGGFNLQIAFSTGAAAGRGAAAYALAGAEGGRTER